MKNVITTGHKNNRLSTNAFSSWLTKINQDRDSDLHGVEKYIMSVRKDNDLTLITTFNGSIYSLPFNINSYNDLIDLIGYKVTLYPKEYDSYALEAFFLWNWERSFADFELGFIVLNKVIDIKKTDSGGIIFFENGDTLPVPHKDHEKPFFRASKRMLGDDSFRDGYKIDFDSKLEELKKNFIGRFVLYDTNLKAVDVAQLSYNSQISVYENSAHCEHVEKDKYKFRQENGVIKRIATWDPYRIPIYLQDGPIMVFGLIDYLRHTDGGRENGLIHRLKVDLQNQVGRLSKFTIIYGGDKKYNNNSLDVIFIHDVESGLRLPRIRV